MSINASKLREANVADFRWLIEAPGPSYLGTRTLSARTDFVWTRDHDAAIHFASEDQANAVLMALRCLYYNLFSFDQTLGPAKAVEHGWVGGESGESIKRVNASL
jgi:hypothetical protein